ncbi:MAG TPA: hypothetical protein VMV94_16390 [Phycisphaerae bacterium]|nr:hypothetical protein [Phycisphaerae bacterium]
MLRFRLLCSLLLPALLLVASGCSAIDPPNGYVKVKDQQSYDLKAVSARGNVIALKSHPNEDRTATLEFWSQAVEYQKVDLDGMKLVKRESIKSKGGLDGVLFNFEAGEGQAKITYLVALYVTPMKIYTVEATGPTKTITEDLDKLRASMVSLR